MANKRLFAEPSKDDSRDPQERFKRTAAKVFSTSKTEIDDREKQWKQQRKRSTR